MARKVIDMDARLIAAVRSSGDMPVAALCRKLGMSRQSFYKYRARYRSEGLDGLEERSRRPLRSPKSLSPMIEDAIVELRKRLCEDGLDAGPGSIRWYLGRDGNISPPSEATIWRVLTRRGMITPQPAKRPKASLRRFEADHPNQRWQADHTGFELADGTEVQILNIIDDHSRLLVASVAAPTIGKEVLWGAFSAAGATWGLPSSCLSDNGLVFSGKLRGFEVDFEIRLREAGIKPITSRPFHPQTCGKVERFQQTLKKWLRADRRHIATIHQLNAALEDFADIYNYRRPHRGIGRATPAERFGASPPAGPSPEPVPAPPRRGLYTINRTGLLTYSHHWLIQIGVHYQHKTAEVLANGDNLAIFVDGTLVRSLTLDRSRRYQPSGAKRGGPRQPRL